MKQNYTNEKNVLILLALLKKHGVRKAIVSPGTTNIALVAGMQKDDFFEVYSSVDERSAAYMACGLASETNEPVILSCTGATASRNYMPGLTEAFYRKLPVLAITSMQSVSKVGHLFPQTLDRSSVANDIVKYSITLPIIKDSDDYWDCEIKVNNALLELTRNGGGPVHINLPTTYSTDYSVLALPDVRVIKRIDINSEFPSLDNYRIAVFIGAHKVFTPKETELLDTFCEKNNAVVFCDHTSGYYGKYRVQFSLVMLQKIEKTALYPDVLIHIGEVSGDYYSLGIRGNQVWRVSEDGEIRDTFRSISYVFEMSEFSFFNYYSKHSSANNHSNYLTECTTLSESLSNKIPELPFSNIWIAQQLASKLPRGSSIHFGILNSLRSWNFFKLANDVTSFSNVGGFGIDGCVSTLIGASLANKNKLYFGVIGDLAFFYDLNSLGNRFVDSNLRILLVNNGKGVEFKHFNHPASCFGSDADFYMAASGHYGNKSHTLVKSYAENLGFKYITASNKDEFEQCYSHFISVNPSSQPILFEVFTNEADECQGLDIMSKIEADFYNNMKNKAKNLIGDKGVSLIKKIKSK